MLEPTPFLPSKHLLSLSPVILLLAIRKAINCLAERKSPPLSLSVGTGECFAGGKAVHISYGMGRLGPSLQWRRHYGVLYIKPFSRNSLDKFSMSHLKDNN